jgi:hypothetical protein
MDFYPGANRPRRSKPHRNIVKIRSIPGKNLWGEIAFSGFLLGNPQIL